MKGSVEDQEAADGSLREGVQVKPALEGRSRKHADMGHIQSQPADTWQVISTGCTPHAAILIAPRQAVLLPGSDGEPLTLDDQRVAALRRRTARRPCPRAK